MSSLHKFRKNITTEKLLFPPDMYINIYGSAAICCYILSKEKPDKSKIIRKWNDLKKNKQKILKIKFNDNSCIDSCLKLFDLKRPDYFPIALVISKYNMLFAPYVNNNLLPLKENGLYSMTLRRGKIYPIKFNDKN